MTGQRKAYLLAAIAVLFWSTMSSAFKISLSYVAFGQLLFWSTLFGAITLTIIMLFNPVHLKGLFTGKALLSSALMGFINPLLYYMVLFRAYELLQAQEAGTLNYTWPIVLVIFSSIFLGQKIKWLNYLAIVISFMGILIIATHGRLLSLDFSSPLGVLLAVASSIAWATYWILNLKDKRQPLPKIALNLVFGWLYISIYLVFTDGIKWPSWEAQIGSLYIGIFEMGITFIIWLRALNLSSNTAKVSNLIYLSPFIALFFIRIFVGETILPSTITGLLFIIGGIIIQTYSDRLMKKEKYVPKAQ